MAVTAERFSQLRRLQVEQGMPSFTHEELEGWQAGRAARRAAGGPFTVMVTGRDGCAGHILGAVMPTLRDITGARVRFAEHPIGGEAIAQSGVTNFRRFRELRFPEASWRAAMTADAILFGAVGSPWDSPDVHPEVPPAMRPQMALMQLRRGFDLFANVRPGRIFPSLAHLSPLRADLLEGVTEITVVRELTGGLYFGQPKGYVQPSDPSDPERLVVDRNQPTGEAVDAMRYTRDEVRRVARVAFELARSKRSRVDSFDKENALVVGRLWRDAVTEVAGEFPDVPCTHWYTDIGLAKLVSNPAQFGIIVTENMFGDIAGDVLGAVTVGSIGMLPSAGFGDGSWPNYFEPVHGSAPKRYPASGLLADSVVNPLATLLSAGMMLFSLGLEREARALEEGVLRTLTAGYRTYDIFKGRSGETKVGTLAMVEQVRANTLRVLEETPT